MPNTPGAAISAGDGDEGTGADEIERREQAERQRAQPSDEDVIFADGAGQHHADEIRGEHGLAVRPGCEGPHAEQQEQEVLGLQLRRAIAVTAEETGGEPGEHREGDHAGEDEDERPPGEGREDEAERQHRAEVVHEAGGEHDLAEVRAVEPELQHDGIHDRDRCGGQGDPDQPGRGRAEVEHEIRDGRTAEERREEACQPDEGRLLPAPPKHGWIQLGAGEEREDDRARAGEELDPRLPRSERGPADGGADDELRDGAHDDLGQRRRDAKPDGEQGGDEREPEP